MGCENMKEDIPESLKHLDLKAYNEEIDSLGGEPTPLLENPYDSDYAASENPAQEEYEERIRKFKETGSIE